MGVISMLTKLANWKLTVRSPTVSFSQYYLSKACHNYCYWVGILDFDGLFNAKTCVAELDYSWTKSLFSREKKCLF